MIKRHIYDPWSSYKRTCCTIVCDVAVILLVWLKNESLHDGQLYLSFCTMDLDDMMSV